MIRLPLLVDAHVHLDKTFTIGRTGRITGGLHASIQRCREDALLWNKPDIAFRAEQALQRAYDYGTCAMRTHIDWTTPATPTAWGVLNNLARQWQGRLHVELVGLFFPELFTDLQWAQRTAKTLAIDRGVMGGFVHAQPNLEQYLDTLFKVSAEHGLRIDLHCDEGIGDHLLGTDIALALTKQYGLQARVVLSHVCALSYRPHDQVQRLLDQAAELQVGIISLPTTNLYLQDRPFEQTTAGGPTPRRRGIAPVHEARQAGVAVALASDNCRDPFYPWGDYNLLHVLEIAALAAQLDDVDAWVNSISSTPAHLMGISDPVLSIQHNYIELQASDLTDAISRRVPMRVVRSTA
jgi:cytosine/creatinine deaminase